MTDEREAARDSCEHETPSESSSTGVVASRLPHTNNVIRGQLGAYSVGRKLSAGRYGAVYEVSGSAAFLFFVERRRWRECNRLTNFQVLRRGDGKHLAAKLEVCDTHFHGLNQDFVVLRNANRVGLSHFCQLYDRGKIENHFKFIVMQMVNCIVC